jgi:hypothetical protein
LIVLTAGDHSDQGLPPQSVAEFERDWRNLQAELATLSTNSQHVVIEGSRHATLQTTYAGVVSDAIRRVVDASRTGRFSACRPASVDWTRLTCSPWSSSWRPWA